MKATNTAGWVSRSWKPIDHATTAHNSTMGVMTNSMSPTVGDMSCFQFNRA
jgi:hypothetical protein